VYILEHHAEGAIGLVLNRPLPDSSITGLEAWFEVASPPAVLFAGGPVELEALVAIGQVDSPSPAAWSEVGNGVGTLDLALDPADAGTTISSLRIFSGYSGWGPGQLEAEMSAGAWIVVAAEPDDLFGADPDGLWRTVLRRQGGRLAWIADAPDDLSMN
jgi:putative transcriptional regulator